MTKSMETAARWTTEGVEIPRLLRLYEAALIEAEWHRFDTIVASLRPKIEMLKYKQSIGETHEQPW